MVHGTGLRLALGYFDFEFFDRELELRGDPPEQALIAFDLVFEPRGFGCGELDERI